MDLVVARPRVAVAQVGSRPRPRGGQGRHVRGVDPELAQTRGTARVTEGLGATRQAPREEREGVLDEHLLAVVDRGVVDEDRVDRALRLAGTAVVAFLLERDYLQQTGDDDDARRKILTVTPRGTELLTTGQRLFDGLRERWAARIGDDELDLLQAQLRELVATDTTRFDTAGWLSSP